MLLKEKPAAKTKAAETFEKLNRLASLPKTTETLSLRVPIGEKERIRSVFARHGLTLANGLKAAVYAYLEQLEAKK